MPTRSRFLVVIVCHLLFSINPVFAQKNRAAKLNENVPLPPDFGVDYQLGLTARVNDFETGAHEI
jgi:hypothetical protein